MTHSYQAHDLLVAPARERAEFWRMPVALLIIVALMFGFGFAAVLLPIGQIQFWLSTGLVRVFGTGLNLDDQSLRDIGEALRILLFLSGFILFSVAILIASLICYQRGLRSLIGPWKLFFLQSFRTIAGLIALGLVLQILPLPEPAEILPGLSFQIWLALLPLAIPLLLIQVGAEELLFRGLLQSQLAARFSSPLVWMGVPTVLFALLHPNPEAGLGANALLIAFIFVYGLSMADITARAGTLGPAIVMHFFNNFSVLLLLSPVGQLDALALNRQEVDLTSMDALLAYAPLQLGVTFLTWVAVRLALWR